MSEESRCGEAEVRELVAALSNYRTRARARRRLVAIGEPAVPALIDALVSPIEGVAWAAAKTLGDIRAETAVEALENVLSRPGVGQAAEEALKSITGGDYAARRAAGRAPGHPTPQKAGMLSDEELARSLSSRTVSCRKHAGGYTITVQLPGGRKQSLEMMLSLKDAGGEPLVAFYTECGPADPLRYEWALKSNLRTPFGAFALRESSEGDKLVMVDAYLRESATVKQLRRAVEVLARRADAMERESTGEDVN